MVVVDDDPGVVSALRRTFRDVDFLVWSTTDPQEALDWIRTGEVAVLVADNQMPVMSGTSLFQLAKSCSPRTARIMLTGHAGEDLVVHARGEGLFELFAKPWDDGDLRRVVLDRFRDQA